MNRLSVKQRWNRRLNWEYAPDLVYGWKRMAAGSEIRWQRIRDAYAAFVTLYEIEVGNDIDRYIEMPWVEFGEAAGLGRHWRKTVIGILEARGFVQKPKDGPEVYRPNPDIRDHRAGWSNAKYLFDQLPIRLTGKRSDRPKSGQTDRTKNTLDAVSLNAGTHARSGDKGSKSMVLTAPKADSGKGGRDIDTDTATVTPPSVSGRHTIQPPKDPTEGIGSRGSVPSARAAPPVPSASGADPAFTQDGGNCVDCGRPIDESDQGQKAVATFIRLNRKAGRAVRWSHRAVPHSTYARDCATAQECHTKVP